MLFLAYCARHLPSDARVAVSSSAEVESNSRYSRGAHGCDGIPALDGRQPCRTLRHESDFFAVDGYHLSSRRRSVVQCRLLETPRWRVLMGRVFLVVRIKGRAVPSQVGRTTGR